MHEAPHRGRQPNWIAVVAVLALADITSMLETMMIFAALKQLMTTFGDASAVGWVVTSYLLVAAASTAISSRLGDLYGHRRVLMAVLMLSAVGFRPTGTTHSLSCARLDATRDVPRFPGIPAPFTRQDATTVSRR